MPINSFIEGLRTDLLKYLPSRSFLKADRGSGLFITNAPVFEQKLLAVPGFICIRSGNMLSFIPSAEHIKTFESVCGDPCGSLSKSMLRFRHVPAKEAASELFAEGLKLILYPEPRAVIMYDRKVRQFCAAGLRTGNNGGTYAAAFIADTLMNQYGGNIT